jgi:hypothetical protein
MKTATMLHVSASVREPDCGTSAIGLRRFRNRVAAIGDTD